MFVSWNSLLPNNLAFRGVWGELFLFIFIYLGKEGFNDFHFTERVLIITPPQAALLKVPASVSHYLQDRFWNDRCHSRREKRGGLSDPARSSLDKKELQLICFLAILTASKILLERLHRGLQCNPKEGSAGGLGDLLGLPLISRPQRSVAKMAALESAL